MSKKYAVDETSVQSSLAKAVAERDLLTLMQMLVPGSLLSFDMKPGCLTDEMVKAACEAENCIEVYERDKALAPLAEASRLAIEAYSMSSGRTVVTNNNCSLEVIKNKGKKEEYTMRISSPLIICGEGHNASDGGACLHVLVKTTTGAWVQEFIPRSELVGGGNVQSRLQDRGLRPGDWAALQHLLQNVEPPRKFKRLEHAGWNGDFYVLPSGEVIPEQESAIATFTPVPNFEVGGTVDGANELLADMVGNSRLIFATGAALSAPIIAHCGPDAEPGGFHFYSASSRGKTTLLASAASMWGRGAEKKDNGIVESWNTTSFAAETTAAQHSDCVLCLDEVKSAKPEHFSSLILGLANGAGKKAGRSDGGMREQKTFRPMVLSTGEISAKDYIESNKHAYHGGMSVRLVDIPAETASGFGVFDVISERFNGNAGAFADYLKTQASTHFGHHGRALVTEFVGDRESFLSDVQINRKEVRAALDARVSKADPQIGRVCNRIAFVCAVSIVAAARGIVPWGKDDITKSALAVFAAWLDARGGEGSHEGLAAEREFSSFVYANPGRFDILERGKTDILHHAVVRIERLGVLKTLDDGTQEYWIAHESGLALMLGNQPERIAPFIAHLKSGKSETWELVDGAGRDKRDTPKTGNLELPKRCYCIRAKVSEVGSDVLANDNSVDDQIPATRKKAKA